VIKVSVVVPCYDRLDLLARTLRACFGQKADGGMALPAYEILVADNHAEQRAVATIAKLLPESPVPLRHIDAGVRNIARARNRGVAAVEGSLIAFVDDDEAPESHWLARLFACLERTGADAAFGPKYPVWQSGKPPRWDQEGLYYTTDFGLPADSEINVLGWRPPRGRGLGTGNSMLRRATCLPGDQPFDEVLGETGGEDSDLFFRLARAGRRFVWCPTAAVHEFVEVRRMEPSYMRARLFRSGQHSVQSRMAVSPHPIRSLLEGVAIGAGQITIHGALALLTGEIFSHSRVSHRFGIAKGMGKLSFAASKSFLPDANP